MKRIRSGFWADKKEKLLKKYDNLTDKDLHFNEGNEQELIESLGSKLGKTSHEILKLIVML
jgi:hypothetical protein